MSFLGEPEQQLLAVNDIRPPALRRVERHEHDDALGVRLDQPLCGLESVHPGQCMSMSARSGLQLEGAVERFEPRLRITEAWDQGEGVGLRNRLVASSGPAMSRAFSAVTSRPSVAGSPRGN